MTAGQPSKAELRKTFRSLRQKLADKKKKSAQIGERVLSLAAFQKASALFCYLPLADEPDTLSVIQQAFALGMAVAAPRCLSEGTMAFFRIESLLELKKGAYGILEPLPAKERLLIPGERDVMLVPGMAFDKNGFRLGYGKGYYDRYLARFSAKTVGLCFNDCLVNALPTTAYDVAADIVVTERQTIHCR